jgi:cyclopropane fatty-acyl-phospholipid synthase-like methyltransferase
MKPADSPADSYEALYREFDSPLMRKLRREAYGEDIGQHSWVRADELRRDVAALELTRSSRLLDLGCGPCGPLTFILVAVGCSGVGLELSPAALAVGRARAESLGVERLLTVQEADLNEPLALEPRAFDAAMSLDVVLHLSDRARLFREVARVLRTGGRFLVTDAGVATGEMSSDEVRRRSIHGHTGFVPPGRNEALLEAAGFRILETEDRTASVMRNAAGRLAAMRAHRGELEQRSGAADYRRQEDYLEAVIELARRRALSRVMYLSENQGMHS